jgi:HAMP domain-containing protein
VLRRAVAIPAGTHRVHWTYTTPGITAGALVAVLGLLGLGALAWLGRRTRAIEIVN